MADKFGNGVFSDILRKRELLPRGFAPSGLDPEFSRNNLHVAQSSNPLVNLEKNDRDFFRNAAGMVLSNNDASLGDISVNPTTASIHGSKPFANIPGGGGGIPGTGSGGGGFGFNKNTADILSSGIGSVSDLLKTFLGFKQLGLGRDQLAESKDQFNRNFTQQTAAANDRRLQFNQTNDAKRRFIQGNSANKDTSFLRDLVPA